MNSANCRIRKHILSVILMGTICIHDCDFCNLERPKRSNGHKNILDVDIAKLGHIGRINLPLLRHWAPSNALSLSRVHL